MKSLLAVLLVTSTSFAQFTLHPNPDGSYTAHPDKYNKMADQSYTPMRESIARSVIPINKQYDWDELGNKYPVRDVVPRSMLTPSDQRAMEDQDLIRQTRKIANDTAILDYEAQKSRNAYQLRVNDEAKSALNALKDLDVDADDYDDQENAFVAAHPYGIENRAVSAQLSALRNKRQQKVAIDERKAYGKAAREEAQDVTLTNEALRSAAQYGDPDLINRVASAPTGRDAMGVVTQAAGQLEQQQYINALTDAGVTGDEWNRFYVQPDQQISPNAKPIFNKEAARAYIATKQKEEVSAPKELEAKYRAAESTLNRLLARKAKGDDWSDDDENKLTRISRVAEDLGQQYLGVEAAAPSTKTQPATMQPPASTQATKQGVSIPTPKSQAEVVSIRNDATATLEKARQMGATPDKIKEITSKINERLISSGIPPI